MIPFLTEFLIHRIPWRKPMKAQTRGERRLASLRKELRRLRLGYAGVLSRKIKVRGDLPARILAVKAKIARLVVEVGKGAHAA